MTTKAQETSPRKLTAKRERFVSEYLIDLNATQAAIRAGYSEKTAEQIGYQLLQITSVAEQIAAGREKQAKRLEINADWVLKRLADEAEADINDIYKEDGSLKPVKEWPRIWRTGLISGIEAGPLGIQKVKLSERVRRLELIGKHMAVGAFVERMEHTGKDGGPIQTENVSDIEAARAIAFLLNEGTRDQATH